ncbi:FLYWCH zinc finger domain-containing protein [Phthorimaea operculella]|nr:FLYWCH zinc finger domain-containing protein [Phthorimaea operculella]
MLLCSYTYNRSRKSGAGCLRWYCCNHHRGCRAAAVTTDALRLIEICGQHDHPPPKLLKTSSGISKVHSEIYHNILMIFVGEMISLGRGNKAMLLSSYMYNRGRKMGGNLRWYCCNYHRGCRAVVVTSDTLRPIEIFEQHDHPPPKLLKTSSGLYFKV